MIDSHCHLDHEPLLTNLEQVISRSKAVGIDKLLTICTTNNGYENILKIVEIDPIIYGTFGIHPHETDFDKTTRKEIINAVSNQMKKGTLYTAPTSLEIELSKLIINKLFGSHIRV